MFTKIFREEPEVLALAVIVLVALFAPPLRLPAPRVHWDLETLAPFEPAMPKVQFIRFR